MKPLFFTHYLTLRCNFKCIYCGFGRDDNASIHCIELDTEGTLKLLSIIRKETAYIYFTGGEPLLRKDIAEILRESRRMKFKSVAVNTNMSLIHKKPELLDSVTNLVASLDALDAKKYAQMLRVSPRIVERLKENIVECAKLQKSEDFVLTVNCVVTPKTISDAREVMEFCFNHDIRFAVVPAEMYDGRPDPRLESSEEYRQLIRDIARAKKQGKPVFGSLQYLSTIYDFKRFECFPMLTPHTYPNGDLFYPCQPMLKVAANLLEASSYNTAVKAGICKHGPLLKCGAKCHKACYIEPSALVRHPLLVFKEFS